MSITTLTTERTALIQLWNATKPVITADHLTINIGTNWADIGALTVPVNSVANPQPQTVTFHIKTRVSNGPNPWTRVRVYTEGSRRHVLKRLAYPSKKGSLTAERLAQDLRGRAGEGDGARAVVREEEALCRGHKRPCGCEGWVQYVCGGATAVGDLYPLDYWMEMMLMAFALGGVYATVETLFGWA